VKRILLFGSGLAIVAFGLFAATSIVFAPVAEAKLQPCQRDYINNFQKRAVHKAFATTGGRSPKSSNTSCGWANSFGTKQAAVRAAMTACRKSGKKFKAPGACQILEAK
jgi:hypothetical protein